MAKDNGGTQVKPKPIAYKKKKRSLYILNFSISIKLPYKTEYVRMVKKYDLFKVK